MNVVTKRMHIFRIVLWVLLAGWLLLIFSMSAKTGESSGGLSRRITEAVFGVWEKIVSYESELQSQKAFDRMHFFIRKGAHFTEYAILGTLIFSLTQTYFMRYKKAYPLSVIASAVYAASDEFHQGFTDGRSPQITDVGIDTLGAAVGCVFALLVWMLIYKVSKRKDTL